MKDIKSYVIGFLTCCCLFLIMGQTKADKNVMEDIKTLLTENGRYQAFGDGDDIYTLDTRTGEIYHAIYDKNYILADYSKMYRVKPLN